jgi:predicted RNA binding protein YcfA (HicA-like mRNA interferase family)
MGKRSTPPLTPSEVVAILGVLGFVLKGQVGAHAQYERLADSRRPRSIVTVDMAESEFGNFLMKSMIRQSNHSIAEFYGATKRTARKASVSYIRATDTPEPEVE